MLKILSVLVILCFTNIFGHEVGTTGTQVVPQEFCKELFNGCHYKIMNETLVIFGNNAMNLLYGRTYLALLGQSETEVNMDLMLDNDFFCDLKSKTTTGDFEFFNGGLKLLHETLSVRDIELGGIKYCEIEFVDTHIINNLQSITQLQNSGFIIDSCFSVKMKMRIKQVEDTIDTDPVSGNFLVHTLAGIHLNMRLNCNEQPSVYENLMDFQLEKKTGNMTDPTT